MRGDTQFRRCVLATVITTITITHIKIFIIACRYMGVCIYGWSTPHLIVDFKLDLVLGGSRGETRIVVSPLCENFLNCDSCEHSRIGCCWRLTKLFMNASCMVDTHSCWIPSLHCDRSLRHSYKQSCARHKVCVMSGLSKCPSLDSMLSSRFDKSVVAKNETYFKL